ELEEKGMPQPYEDVLRDIIERDRQDREREASPCVPAEDAVQFVNDDYGIEESADYIIGLIK
ncbi:MAG: (d)CMP kinase, partial [Clostridia bacterium]|nr:(d)CMP kinase [Clostridia bacterium]